ncbi:LysR family transcriptional regulator [Octadecabacter antarcticus 307]|uniref:LysR family transcriptional regulator n=2 Tax=Octadecabacter TaxID=53945 RepID=M9R7X1_9RHOB|nr:LysR family transcriptional regulator [Octadecabacter antarcticus 307]
MDMLGAFESFVSAVQSGSLSGAARQRSMSQPAISQQISALETKLNTRLLSRNRSGVRMTPSGEIVFRHAVAMLDEQANLKTALEDLSDKVEGQLVVTANLAFCQHIMGEVIIELSKQFPDLKIVLRADDRILDLAAENIDFALRSGLVGDGKGVVQKIGTLSILHVATPEYLDTAGRPQTPDDLINLAYIQYKATDDRIATLLLRGTDAIQAPIKIGLTAQFPGMMFQAINGHLGYAKMPEFLVLDAALLHKSPLWRASPDP